MLNDWAGKFMWRNPEEFSLFLNYMIFFMLQDGHKDLF